MINRILVLFLILTVSLASSADANEESKSDNIIKISSYEVKSSEVISLSIEAINKSFENIARGKKTENFPDNPGPMNFPFPISKDHNYDRIVGYEFKDSDPTVVTFLIGTDGYLGLHIAVVKDIAKMEVIKVYNRSGS